MPAERLSMRKIKEVLRIHAGGLSGRKIAPIVGVGATTVREYLARAKQAALSWPLPAELDDETLERRLFPPAAAPSARPQSSPDWAAVHQEMRRRGVTLQLLWQEYRTVHPSGYCCHIQTRSSPDRSGGGSCFTSIRCTDRRNHA